MSSSPLHEQPSTGDDSISHIPANRTQRVRLDHTANLAQLLLGLSAVNLVGKLNSFPDTHICPVLARLVIAVIWEEDMVEYVPLVLIHVVNIADTVEGVLCCDMVSSSVGAVGQLHALVPQGRVGMCVCHDVWQWSRQSMRALEAEVTGGMPGSDRACGKYLSFVAICNSICKGPKV